MTTEIKGLKFDKITIAGKEYEFLKPKPVQLMDLEDECYKTNENGEIVLDSGLYADQLIKIVDKSLVAKDFIKFNPTKIELSNGKTIEAIDIGYERYNKAKETLARKVSRKKMAMMYIECCGLHPHDSLTNPKADVDETFIVMTDLTYDDLLSLAEAFSMLYDDSELVEITETIATFLHA